MVYKQCKVNLVGCGEGEVTAATVGLPKVQLTVTVLALQSNKF